MKSVMIDINPKSNWWCKKQVWCVNVKLKAQPKKIIKSAIRIACFSSNLFEWHNCTSKFGLENKWLLNLTSQQLYCNSLIICHWNTGITGLQVEKYFLWDWRIQFFFKQRDFTAACRHVRSQKVRSTFNPVIKLTLISK